MTHVERAPLDKAIVAAHKLDAVAWGVFFLWVGIALIAQVGWGVGLLGVGILTLGGQVGRKYFDLAIEPFWIVVGVLFILAGGWEIFGVRFSLVPVVLIIAGLALLLSALGRRTL